MAGPDRDLLDHYPQPLARIYLKLWNAERSDRCQVGYEAFECLARYLVAVTVGWILQSKHEDPMIRSCFLWLTQPHAGDWGALLDRAFKRMGPDQLGPLTPLKELWRRPRAIEALARLQRRLAGRPGAASADERVTLREVFARAVTFRNDVLAHGASRPGASKEDLELGQAFFDAFPAALREGGCLREHGLVYLLGPRRVDGHELSAALSLEGMHPVRVDDVGPAPAKGVEQLHARVGDRWIPLEPLLSFFPDAGEVQCLKEIQEQGALYLSYATGQAREGHADASALLGRGPAPGWVVRAAREAPPRGGTVSDEQPIESDEALPPDPAAPRKYGKFELERLLGRGAHAEVYHASVPTLGRRVALKIPNNTATGTHLRRLQQEGQALARLKHPNLVEVFEVNREGEPPFISMEFVEGRTVRAWIEERQGKPAGPKEQRLVAGWIEAAARGVHHAHGCGIIHRDLKPENLLIDAQGKIKVVDFGIARDAAIGPSTGRLTELGELVGTPAFMSPEQAVAGAPVDDRTDVYSLGATLFAALAGRDPYEGTDALQLRLRVVTGDVPNLPGGIAPDLAAIVHKAMERVQERRYAAAELLAEDLARFLDGRQTLARPLGRAERARRWGRRHSRALAAIAGGGVTVVMLILGGTTLERRRALSEARAAAEREHAAFAAPVPAGGAGRATNRARLEAGLAWVSAVERLVELLPKDHDVERERRGAVLEVVQVATDAEEWRTAERLCDRAAGADPEGIAPVRSDVAAARDRSEAVKLIGGGAALGWAGRWGEARQSFERAHELARPGSDEWLAAELGLWRVLRASPPPVVEFPVAERGAGPRPFALSPDGRQVAVGHPGQVTVWELIGARRERELQTGDGTDVRALCWSDAGLIVAHLDSRVVVLTPGRPPLHVDLAATALACVGSLVAIGRADGGVEVGAVRPAGLERRELRRPFALPVRSINLSRDGRRIAATSGQSVAVVDVDAERQFAPWVERHAVQAAALGPDGDEVWVGLVDGSIVERRCADGTRTGRLGDHGHFVSDVAVVGSRGDEQVVSASMDGTVRAWDASLQAELLRLGPVPGGVAALAISRDERLVVAMGNDGALRVWRLGSEPSVTISSAHADRVHCVAFSADETLAASGGWDGVVRVWDVATGLPLLANPTHADEVRCVAFSRDGQTVFSGGARGELYAWDLLSDRDPELLGGLNEGGSIRSTVHGLALSDDGRWLVAGTFAGEVGIFRLPERVLVKRFQAHEQFILDVALVGPDERLTTASADREVAIWGTLDEVVAVATPRPTWRAPFAETVISLDSSADRTRFIATARDGTLRHWTVARGADPLETACLPIGPRYSATCIFAPVGTGLLAGGPSGTLRLWDVRNQQAVCDFEGHKGTVWSTQWSRDGGRLLSGSFDGKVAFWDLRRPEQLRALGSRRSAEWLAFHGLWGEAADLAEARGESVAPAQLAAWSWRGGRFEAARRHLGAAPAQEPRRTLCQRALERPPSSPRGRAKRKPYFGLVGDHDRDRRYEGLKLVTVIDGSPAHAAGLLAGDIIVGIGGLTVRGQDDFNIALQEFVHGDVHLIRFLRNGIERSTTVVLLAR